MIMPGIVLCVSLLVFLPSPTEARATGGWLRFLKMLEEMEEDYPYPSSEEDEAVPLHPSPNRIGWIEGEIPVNLDDVEEGNVGGCGGGIYWTGLCDYTKNEILRLHNKYRATVAMGRESRGGGLPAASDMREMVDTLFNIVHNVHIVHKLTFTSIVSIIFKC